MLRFLSLGPMLFPLNLLSCRYESCLHSVHAADQPCGRGAAGGPWLSVVVVELGCVLPLLLLPPPPLLTSVPPSSPSLVRAAQLVHRPVVGACPMAWKGVSLPSTGAAAAAAYGRALLAL